MLISKNIFLMKLVWNERATLRDILKWSCDCLLYTKKETNCVLFIVNIWLHYFYLTWKRS